MWQSSFAWRNTGFNIKYWDATIVKNDNKVVYSYVSNDGEEGYPGNLNIKVSYSIIEKKLIIDYTATTDKPTPINLTNHSYFNLNGNYENNIEQHYLQLYSNKLMDVNEDCIPTGNISDCSNTKYDFNKPTLLKNQYKEILNYDNSWVFEKGDLQKVAKVFNNNSGIELTCYTTMPSIHFYDGHYLSTPFQSKQGFCLEAQFLPDSPNHPTFPSTILQPNQVWQQQTIYELGLIN